VIKLGLLHQKVNLLSEIFMKDYMYSSHEGQLKYKPVLNTNSQFLNATQSY